MADVDEKKTSVQEEIDLDALRREFDTEAGYRDLKGVPAVIVTALAVCMSLFHLYTSGFGLMQSLIQASVHLAFVLVLVFLLYPISPKLVQNDIPWYDYALAILGAFVTLYLVVEFDSLIGRAGLPTTMDIVVSFLGIAVLLEATRRVTSPVLPIIAICFLLY
ncbi:MAG: C4-dicarboxylate ABC transporter permease, partial [Synergistaceae bacterium]|nr:C4-dicarboxylate ABC transporter permease [Synergistaceae bacterium]